MSTKRRSLHHPTVAFPEGRQALLDFEIFARATRFVCAEYSVTPSELEGRHYDLRVIKARRRLVWLIRRHTTYSVRQIGDLVGRPTSVIQGMLDFEIFARATRFVCAEYSVTPSELKGRHYDLRVISATWRLVWLIRRHTTYSLRQIGDLVGRPTSVIQGMLDSLAADVQGSCYIAREVLALDCAFRRFECLADPDDKPF